MIGKAGGINAKAENLPIVHQHRGKKMMDKDAINYTSNPIIGSTQTFDKTNANMVTGHAMTRSHRYNLEPQYNTLSNSVDASPVSVGSIERQSVINFNPVNLTSAGI